MILRLWYGDESELGDDGNRVATQGEGQLDRSGEGADRRFGNSGMQRHYATWSGESLQIVSGHE